MRGFNLPGLAMNIWPALAAALALCAGATTAVAQSAYPTAPIRILVSYPPGGFPDTVTRIFGDQLRKSLNQPILIENRPSAGSIIAGQAVARAAPDGYTLLAGDSQMWGIAPAMFKSLPYDAIKDFEPVSVFATTSNYLVVSATVPVSGGLPELLAFLKANPGKYNYGTAGIGSLHHLTMETLIAQTGLQVSHIPYKGNSQILPALVAGEVAIGVQSLTALPNFVKQGKIRMVAIAADKRSKAYPDMPTFDEFGIKGMGLIGTMALLAPKGTPAPVIERLWQAVKAASQDAELIKRIEGVGADPHSLSPAESTEWIRKEAAALMAAAKLAKIEPE